MCWPDGRRRPQRILKKPYGLDASLPVAQAGCYKLCRPGPDCPMNIFTRRIFVATSVAVLGAFSLRCFGGPPLYRDLARYLVRIFEGQQSSARAIGNEHLRRTPMDASATRLVSLICAERSEPPPIGHGPRAIREWVCARSRDDFRAGRVVEIQGWILSATEVRLCALAAIS